jgi:diaminohydroxyphosphoribosylaminopyrimidine deaminase/5-amino-6-(5-phosphoribosylamino)uracil reductase
MAVLSERVITAKPVHRTLKCGLCEKLAIRLRAVPYMSPWNLAPTMAARRLAPKRLVETRRGQGRHLPCWTRIHSWPAREPPSCDKAGITSGSRFITLKRKQHQLNEPFIKWMMVKQPFIVAKLAQSLDGRIASRTGKSQWITNNWARRYGHYLRSVYDGILVGINTILLDNPMLTCRIEREGQEAPHQPVRIVLDSQGRIPLTARVVMDQTTSTIVVTTEQCPSEKKTALEKAGVQVLIVPQREGHVDLPSALEALGQAGIQSILIEGGSAVQGSFFDAHMVDKIYAFLGNKVLGGKDALSSVSGIGVDGLDECMPLTYDSVELNDGNILITAYNAERKGAYVHWNH